MSKIPDFETLEEAKQFLRENWEKGTLCPCCKQTVKLYRHKVNAQVAKVLIDMYNTGDEWINIFSDLKPKTTMYSIARFWGLIEPRGDEPENNSKSSGYWRLTPKGIRFVKSENKIPKYAFIFNDEVYRISEEVVDIKSSLGSKFNYEELMKHY